MTSCSEPRGVTDWPVTAFSSVNSGTGLVLCAGWANEFLRSVSQSTPITEIGLRDFLSLRLLSGRSATMGG